MKQNVIKSDIYPIVSKSLANKENQLKIKNAVSGYLDRNNEKLSAIGPMYLIPFLDSDKEKMYDAIGLAPIQIKAALKESHDISSQWKIMNDPFNTAMATSIKYFMETNNKEMADMCVIYFTLSMYPSIHYKYFQFEPNENIMTYTINNLSNKYKIKQLGTVYAALYDTAKLCYESNESRLKAGTDKDYIYYVQDEKNRLNMLIQKIANEFYENKKNEKYINLEMENFEDGNYRESQSDMFAVDRITNSVVMKLTVDGPDIRFINIASSWCKVSNNELRNYVTTKVTSDNRQDIQEIVSSILYLFIYESQNNIKEINSNKFLTYCLGVYKKSNTTDKNIIKIKEILDKWLEDLGTYKKTQRIATINDFRRAIFMFFVISIQQVSQY